VEQLNYRVFLKCRSGGIVKLPGVSEV